MAEERSALQMRVMAIVADTDDGGCARSYIHQECKKHKFRAIDINLAIRTLMADELLEDDTMGTLLSLTEAGWAWVAEHKDTLTT